MKKGRNPKAPPFVFDGCDVAPLLPVFIGSVCYRFDEIRQMPNSEQRRGISLLPSQGPDNT